MALAAQQTERLKTLAQERGGRLISAAYVDAATPLQWECAFGHRWNALAEAVSRHRCVECAHTGVYDSAAV